MTDRTPMQRALDRDTQIEELARENERLREALLPNTAALSRLLAAASIGSCSCDTKSPDTAFHAANCRYVHLTYAMDRVADLDAAIGKEPK